MSGYTEDCHAGTANGSGCGAGRPESCHHFAHRNVHHFLTGREGAARSGCGPLRSSRRHTPSAPGQGGDVGVEVEDVRRHRRHRPPLRPAGKPGRGPRTLPLAFSSLCHKTGHHTTMPKPWVSFTAELEEHYRRVRLKRSPGRAHGMRGPLRKPAQQRCIPARMYPPIGAAARPLGGAFAAAL